MKLQVFDSGNRIDFKHPINFTAVFFLNLLFGLFYLLFFVFADSIHSIGLNNNIQNITPWLRHWMEENDGIELYVMMLAMPVYLVVGYLISKNNNITLGFPNNKWIPVIYVAVIAVIFSVNYLITDHPQYFKHIGIIFFVVSGLSVTSVKLSQLVLSGWSRILLLLLFFIVLSATVLLISNSASVFDCGFYIGPANKILAGENLGSFYMQYNMLGTLLFVLMQKSGLQLHEMLLVLVFIFSFWIYLYQRAAVALFNNRSFVFLFLVALILVRCLAIWGGPVSIPQVSPIRMDLWVPLIIVLMRFGFNSIFTASAFSICYLADDVFGFMYMVLYAVNFIVINLTLFKEDYLKFVRTTIIYLIPVMIVLILHFLIFGSISSSSGKIYSEFHIGFLPISMTSSFWFIAWLLPVCLYILIRSKKDQMIHFFIVGIACIELTYFFGRSHDHNLLNISGIFIFILFLTLDSLYTASFNNKRILYATILLIGALGINYSSSIMEKWNIAVAKINSNSVTEPNPVEKELALQGNYLKTFGTDKILVVSDIDSYINYRLGYHQIGYFSPFCTNLFIDQTAVFLKVQMSKGYRLIIFPGIWNKFENDIQALNGSLNNERFIVMPLEHGLSEIKLVSN